MKDKINFLNIYLFNGGNSGGLMWGGGQHVFLKRGHKITGKKGIKSYASWNKITFQLGIYLHFLWYNKILESIYSLHILLLYRKYNCHITFKLENKIQVYNSPFYVILTPLLNFGIQIFWSQLIKFEKWRYSFWVDKKIRLLWNLWSW